MKLIHVRLSVRSNVLLVNWWVLNVSIRGKSFSVEFEFETSGCEKTAAGPYIED